MGDIPHCNNEDPNDFVSICRNCHRDIILDSKALELIIPLLDSSCWERIKRSIAFYSRRDGIDSNVLAKLLELYDTWSEVPVWPFV